MKKTIIALIALAGVTYADTAVWDLTTSVTEGAYLYDADNHLFKDNGEVEGTVLNETDGASRIQTNICFVLNLTEAMGATYPTEANKGINIIKMDMGGDVGLALTSTGLAGIWGDDTNGRGSVTYTTLLQDSGVFTNADGDKCITLTFVETYGSGVQVWSNTTKLINDTTLRASGNTSLTSIYINNGYIDALQFAPGWEGDSIVNTNKAFDKVAKDRLIPEPTTATLSLLALAGLAARRRRR